MQKRQNNSGNKKGFGVAKLTETLESETSSKETNYER